MEEYTVSIIVPIYNAERYLEKCLESLFKQTYKNLNILLINDGSTDNSEDICLKYCSMDNRFTYYSNSNHGVGYTRNFGIEHSKGEYIVFVDSDDICNPQMIEIMVNNQIENDTQLVVCGINVFNNFINNSIDILKEKDYKFTLKEYIESILLKWQADIYTAGPYGKLFLKKNILNNNIRFNESIIFAEDFIFNLDYLSFCNQISVCSEVLYNYRQNVEGSLTYKNFHNFEFNNTWNSRLFAYKNWEKFFNDNNILIDVNRMHYLIVMFICSVIRIDVRYTQSKKEIFSHIKYLLTDEFNLIRINQCKGITKSEKLKIILCKYKLYYLLYFLCKLRNS